MDFDEEARKLWANLALTPAKPYNSLDPIFTPGQPLARQQQTSAAADSAAASPPPTVYVGNERAAKDATLLSSLRITHVVNCTDNIPNYHERGGAVRYMRFPVTFWQLHCADGDAATLGFADRLFEFVDAALAAGGSVLVHCLAGAHRAGTTGCLLLMRQHRLGPSAAIALAKQRRPAIDPIGGLPQFLERYHRARAAEPG